MKKRIKINEPDLFAKGMGGIALCGLFIWVLYETAGSANIWFFPIAGCILTPAFYYVGLTAVEYICESLVWKKKRNKIKNWFEFLVGILGVATSTMISWALWEIITMSVDNPLIRIELPLMLLFFVPAIIYTGYTGIKDIWRNIRRV